MVNKYFYLGILAYNATTYYTEVTPSHGRTSKMDIETLGGYLKYGYKWDKSWLQTI